MEKRNMDSANYFVDTHTHLYLPQFDTDRDAVITKAIEGNVQKILLPNIDLSTIESMNDMVVKYQEVCYSMMGLHPCSVKEDYRDVLNTMEKLFKDGSYIGVGETGTDLYWDKTTIEEQKDAFIIQMEWAKDLKLPIVIHSRESLDLNINLIEENQDGRLRGVFHCFNGTVEQAERIKDLGFMMGIGGVSTFKNASIRTILAELPLESLILETDSPYLTPTPHRGQRNESSYIPLIAEHLAVALGETMDFVAELTTNNAYRLFGKCVNKKSNFGSHK